MSTDDPPEPRATTYEVEAAEFASPQMQANSGGMGTSLAPMASGSTQATGYLQPRYTQLPADDITTKPIRPDQAKALAMTRRTRIGDFSLGALIAVAPGAIQTIVDWVSDPKNQWPSAGHIVEIVFAIMALTAVGRSLLDFADPTSRDVLEDLFPGAGKQTSYSWRLGMLVRRIKNDFNNL